MKKAVLTGGTPGTGDRMAGAPGRIGYLAIVDASADMISVVDSLGKIHRFAGAMREAALGVTRADELRAATASVTPAQDANSSARGDNGEFLAVMCHEIRTPLTAAIGFVDLLAQTDDLTQAQRRYIEVAQAANGALLNVVDDILDFSKFESHRPKLQIRAFSLAAVVQETLQIAAPGAADKNLAMSFAIAPDATDWLMGDPERLRHVLLKLLNNAVKFTKSGSIEVDVRSQTLSGGREGLRVSVADTGIGIPAALHARVFESFFQADGSLSRRSAGIGLGLAICRQSVDAMGGEMGIDSDEGRGATVWFTAYLPPATEPAPAKPVPFLPQDAARRQARILVVDDTATNLEIVEAYLTVGGYSVDTAGSAAEAIRRLEDETYDLVLMDIQMPVMDGIAATRRIRSLPNCARDIPIIAMTGNVLPAQVRSFLEAGMSGHVGKPIDRAKLYHSIRDCLRGAERGEAAGPSATG